MALIIALFICTTLHHALTAPTDTFQPQITGEIKSYHQVGDKIRGELARLHPDGSVTKTLAFGDTKQGLQYKAFQMDPLGNVKAIDPATANQLNPAGPSGDQVGQSGPGAQAMTPGVNWFLQQPLVSPASPLGPFDSNPFANPFANPLQDPLAANPPLGNPMWNLLNF